MLSTWPRHLVRAASGLCRAPGRSLSAASTLAAALLLIGAYAMILANLAVGARAWGRGSFVTCGLAAAEAPAWQEVAAELGALPGVAHAALVPPQAALARFAARGPEAAALVAGADVDALPASVELTLADGADPGAVVAAAAAVVGVDTVDDGGDEQASVEALLAAARACGVALGLLIALTATCMVANTVRLAVYQEREEVAILELVGATRRFIAAPFVLQGLAWGLAGGLAASLALWAAHRLYAPRLGALLAPLTGGAPVRLIVAELPPLLMLGGALVSATISRAAVRRCLARELR